MEILLIIAAMVATAPIVYSLIKTGKNDETLDTLTQGNITLFTEISCLPLTEALVTAFQRANPLAHIEVRSGNEKEAFAALKDDTSRLVVMPRNLTEKEMFGFRERYFVPRIAEFAKVQKTGSPITLFNNQARDGIGRGFMAFVASESGNEVVRSFGLEPVVKSANGKKTTTQAV